jgi:hypothetical protein
LVTNEKTAEEEAAKLGYELVVKKHHQVKRKRMKDI